MPVLSWGHSHFWSGASQQAPGSPTSSIGGYPTWQATTLTSAGFLFGGLQPVWQWVVTIVKKDAK